MILIIVIDKNGLFLKYELSQENFDLKVDDEFEDYRILEVITEDNYEYEISVVKIKLNFEGGKNDY